MSSFPLPRPGIEKIKPHMVTSFEYSVPVSIALDSNESALGASARAIEAAAAATVSMHRYHNNTVALLSSEIADNFGLDQSRITVGSGSDELLARIAKAYLGPGSELIRSANGYLKVPNYAYGNDGIPVNAPDKEFTSDIESILSCVTPQTSLVYLANPDNPSGTYIGTDKLRSLIERLPPSVLLVLDCAYEEFVDVADYEPTTNLVEQYNNVVVTRTFSKIYGLAGARVGWMYAHPEVINTLNRIGLTFPIAAPSIAACRAALQDQQHFHRVREFNRHQRAILTQGLQDLNLKTYPSQTNFVLAEFNRGKHAITAEGCAHYLRERGVSIRRFASRAYDDCIRITVGLPHEQERALELMQEAIKA